MVCPEPKAPPREEPRPAKPLAPCEADNLLPTEAAHRYLEKEELESALACAAKGAVDDPNDVLAHIYRVEALAGLERHAEAQRGLALVLAIAPDSLDALLAAATYYGMMHAERREDSELALVYAERGYAQANDLRDAEMAGSFARVSAHVFNDLGRSSEALERATAVLKTSPEEEDMQAERAIALFELCRFKEAEAAFQKLRTVENHEAIAEQHLGLILERRGRANVAAGHFAKAHSLAPETFPAPVIISAAEFREQMQKSIERLPKDMRKDLAKVPVTVEDLPRDDDLRATDPPLSPSILGLFRGPSLGEACPKSDGKTPCRAVVLYRLNLARAATTREELNSQIDTTILHELGHLRGEDDEELVARGLE